MTRTCQAPNFRWDAERHVYGPCTNCGRLAWDHEQCDPMADLIGMADFFKSRPAPNAIPPAPVMRSQ